MTKEEIFYKIQDHTAHTLGLDKAEIEMDSSFRDDLGCDSLMVAELVMVFEDNLGIEIPDDDAEKLSTVSSVVEYALQHLP